MAREERQLRHDAVEKGSGALAYFQFENIVRIARVLCDLDGAMLNTAAGLLRQPLESGTGLPFAPSHCKVWRNYARTFACSMLAKNIGGKVFATDVCRKFAEAPCALTSDQYFNFVFSRFTLPFRRGRVKCEGFKTLNLTACNALDNDFGYPMTVCTNEWSAPSIKLVTNVKLPDGKNHLELADATG